ASTSATSALTERPRPPATARSASQNSASSEMLVRWPARTTERFLISGLTAGGSRRAEHRFGTDPAGEILGADIAERLGRLLQRRPLLMRRLGDLGGLVVANMRAQRRHQHQRLAKELVDARAVGLDAGDAAVGEAAAGIGEEADRAQHVGDDDRLEDVE